MSDAYTSVFTYQEEMNEHIKVAGTVRGYDGPVYTGYVHFDFDSDIDVTRAQKDTVELLDRMELFSIDVEKSCKIHFSGKKGFHVILYSKDIELISGRNDTNAIVKHVASKMAEGLKCFDSTPYDKTRLIRATNSLHGKSDMYKIPLTFKEIKTMMSSEIMSLARTQRDLKFETEPCSSQYIYEIIKDYEDNGSEKRQSTTSKSGLLLGLRDGFSSGERNSGLASVAGMLHSRGLSDDLVLEYTALANTRNDPPLPDIDVETIVRSVTRYKIDQKYIPEKDEDIKTMKDAYDTWRRQKLLIRDRGLRLSSGFGRMDKGLYSFDEGKVMMIAARPGVGKTLMGMQVANTMATSLGGKVLFSSLEMQSSAIFYRASRIDASETMAEVENEEFTEFLLDNEDECMKTVSKWNNMLTVDRDGLSLEQIEAYYNRANENGEIKVLLIDYLGLVSGTNDYKGLSDVARELKNMAKRLNTRVIILVQLNRKAGDGTQEVFLDHLADSGQVEAAADIILGMWLSPDDPSRIHVKSCKNRDDRRDRKYDFIQKGMSYTETDFDDSQDFKEETKKGPKGW
jgi:KaiC/GvpD/RAD55 family RecA-like ATPase